MKSPLVQRCRGTRPPLDPTGLGVSDPSALNRSLVNHPLPADWEPRESRTHSFCPMTSWQDGCQGGGDCLGCVFWGQRGCASVPQSVCPENDGGSAKVQEMVLAKPSPYERAASANSSLEDSSHFFLKIFKKCLHLREIQSRTEKAAQAGGAEAEAEGEADSPLSREPDLGLHPRTWRSCPEPKADT